MVNTEHLTKNAFAKLRPYSLLMASQAASISSKVASPSFLPSEVIFVSTA
jgi:hypothetical protein